MARTMSKLMAGEREEVLQEMRELYAETGQEPAVGLALGTLLRHVGKHQTAVRTQRSLLLRPDLPHDFKALILTELACDYLELGLLERSRLALEEAVQLQGVDGWRAKLGEQLYCRLEDFDTAAQLVLANAKRVGKDMSARVGLIRFRQGELLLRRGDPAGAMTAWKKAMSADPGCVPAILAAAAHHRRHERPDKALSLLRKKLKQNHLTGYEWLAFAELEQLAIVTNDNAVLIEPVLTWLVDHPDDWRVRRILSHFQMETGQHSEASENLMLCLEAAPRGLILHEQLRLLLTRGDQPWDLFEEYHAFLERDQPFRSGFACSHCDYRAGEMLWWCPSCRKDYSFVERTV